MKLAGIDYSMTSPSVCIFDGDSFHYKNCRFFYLTDKHKLEGDFGQFVGTIIDDFSHPQQRYNYISKWAMTIIYRSAPTRIFIEDYAFAATGRVFGIGENTGLLKYKMWMDNWQFTAVPPTVIKKFATGKGNANKEAMQESFVRETKVDVKKLLGMTEAQWNPSSDIIDSYYICKYGYDQTNIQPTSTILEPTSEIRSKNIRKRK